MALDLAGRRLFVAALGNGTVEVVDLRAGAVVRTLRDFHEPQGVGFAPSPARLFVGNAGDGTCAVLDGNTFERLRTVPLGSDADNIRYDGTAHRMLVGCCDGALAILDAATGDDLGRVRLPAHPEAFQLESGGPRAFVNVPDRGEVVVVDRSMGRVLETWKLGAYKANFPMAYDEAGHRLFVGCREPAALVVLDDRTGRMVASAPIDGDPDDLFYDAPRGRLYAVCGAGFLDVLSVAGGPSVLARVPTGRGARTGLFVPELERIIVAVPHRGGQRAELRVFALDESPGATR